MTEKLNKRWIAITRITEESGHYTKLVSFTGKWNKEIIDNKVRELVKDNWDWENMEDIIYIVDRCTIYIFNNEDYANRILSIESCDYNVEWADIVEAEIMDNVYRAFADTIIQPKEED